MDPTRKDFFISYTGADTAWAEWIAFVLEEGGYRVVFQAWDVRPGSNFVHEMRVAMDSADRTVAVVSPAYLASVYATAEWTAAFTNDEAGTNSMLMVLVAACELPRLLRPWVTIDLTAFGVGEQAAREHLLDGVRGALRAKPAARPPFPAPAAGADHGDGGDRSAAEPADVPSRPEPARPEPAPPAPGAGGGITFSGPGKVKIGGSVVQGSQEITYHGGTGRPRRGGKKGRPKR